MINYKQVFLFVFIHFLFFFSLYYFSYFWASSMSLSCDFLSRSPRSMSKSTLSKLQEFIASKLYFFDSCSAACFFCSATSFSILYYCNEVQIINKQFQQATLINIRIYSYDVIEGFINFWLKQLIQITILQQKNNQTQYNELEIIRQQLKLNQNQINNLNTKQQFSRNFLHYFNLNQTKYHIFNSKRSMSKLQYQQKPASSENVQHEERHQGYKRHDNQDNYRKPRYQDKEVRYKNKYGFDYDEKKISYNSEIPEMPEKPKAKPDENKLNKRIEEMQTKVKQLKKLRKQKKDTYKNGSKTFTDQIEAQKHNIELAKACLVVLNFDKNILDQDLEDVENKINQHKKKIDFINRPTQKSTKINKIEEMNYQELVKEEDRITQEMSTKSLSKAEEVELSSKLNKIKKRKVQVPKENVSVHQNNEKYHEIQSHKNTIERLRSVKQRLTDKSTDINNKIESIEEDIQEFEDNIEQIHEKLRNTDNSKLLEEAAEYKQQILTLWDEIEELKQQHKKKVAEYDQEQEQIKYIQWANDIKTKKAEAWEAEKQERKKQRIREKEKQKKDQKPTKDGDKKQGEKTEEEKPAFERKRINRNQKQIDSCAFLIQYCKDLNTGSGKTDGQSTSQKEVKLEEALKKGEWAKMKNVEVIQSKKKKAEQEPEQKAFKKKEIKPAVQQPTDRFSHTYFVAQVFDSVKVLPPAKPQDLQKLVNELQDKMQYYIAHPDEQVNRSSLPAKEADTKAGKAPRRIINTEEFPSLR